MNGAEDNQRLTTEAVFRTRGSGHTEQRAGHRDFWRLRYNGHAPTVLAVF
jgi:hypothetical protein